MSPAEVIATIEAMFGRDMDGWLACFDVPMVFVTPRATLTFASHDDARAFFEPQWAALVGAGFDRTEADQVVVEQLGDDVALVDAHFTRRRTDGSELERLAALYTCRWRDDRWLVASLVRHPHEHQPKAN